MKRTPVQLAEPLAASRRNQETYEYWLREHGAAIAGLGVSLLRIHGPGWPRQAALSPAQLSARPHTHQNSLSES